MAGTTGIFLSVLIALCRYRLTVILESVIYALCNHNIVLHLAYMAPEVFTHTSPVGRGADIWSLGCVLIEMVTGNVSCLATCEMVFIVLHIAVRSAIYYSIEWYCF
jgi:hypothetical protein